MNVTNPETFNTAVWLIPLLLLVSLLVLAMLARFWREKAWVAWLQLNEEMAQAEQEYNGLVERNLEYRSEEREPYRKRAKVLDGQLKNLNEQLETQSERLHAAHQQMERQPDNIFQALFGAVFVWYGMRKELGESNAAGKAIDDSLILAGQTLASLDALVSQMAEESRLGLDSLEKIVRRSDLLSEWKAQGSGLEKFDERLDRLHAAFALLPEGFISGNPQALEVLDRNAVIQAYETIIGTRPVLQELAQLSHHWLSLLRKMEEVIDPTGKKLEAMSLEMGRSSQIDLSGLSGKIMESIQVYETIVRKLDRPDVDTLEGLYNQAVELQGKVTDLDHQYRQTLKQYSGLSRVYTATYNGLEHLDQDLTNLEAAEKYPIRWEMTRHKAGVLRKRLAEVGALESARLPEKVQQDSEILTDISRQIDQLIQKTAQLRHQHDRFVQGMQDEMVQTGEKWVEETRQLATKVSHFDPVNFSPEDQAESLLTDLDSLLIKQRKHYLPSSTTPIGEGQIEERLQQLETLLDEHRLLRARVKRTSEQVAWLGVQESDLKTRAVALGEWLAACRIMLEREKIIRRTSEGDLAALASQAQQVEAAIENINEGAIQDKIKLVEALEGDAGKAARRWLKFLSDGLSDMQASLVKTLGYLDDVAQIDDISVEQARKLIEPGMAFGAQPVQDLEGQKNMLDRLTQTWAAGLLTYRAVEEVEGLVSAAVDSAEERRLSCLEILQEAEKVIPAQPGWPPVAQSLQQVKQEWAKIEASWDVLVERNISVGWLVKELGGIEREVQKLEGEISRIRFQADQEIQKVREKEAELASLIEGWRAIQMRYSQNPGIKRVIDLEIETTEQGKKSIEQRFRRGILSYDQAVKSLELLCQQTAEKSIELGDGSRINLKGEIS